MGVWGERLISFLEKKLCYYARVWGSHGKSILLGDGFIFAGELVLLSDWNKTWW